MRLKTLFFLVPVMCFCAATGSAATSETMNAPRTEAAADARESENDEPSHDEADEEQAGDEETSIEERLDALLSEVASYEDREVTRCLNTRSYRTVRVLNTDYLLFARGERYWLNKLKRTCQSLKWNDLPVFESRGSSSLCEGDPFYPTNSMDLQRGLDASGRPRAIHGTCFLGSFETITAEQASLLMGRK
jgi:hypothetical protein